MTGVVISVTEGYCWKVCLISLLRFVLSPLLGYSHPCLFKVSDETSDAKSEGCHERTSF